MSSLFFQLERGTAFQIRGCPAASRFFPAGRYSPVLCAHRLNKRIVVRRSYSVKDYILERMLSVAQYILDTGATVRACADHFKVSKTTVHKDVVQRLSRHNPALFMRVRAVLDENKAQRHIRGGMATRQKYIRSSEAGKPDAVSGENGASL